jgi:hypothetical protein
MVTQARRTGHAASRFAAMVRFAARNRRGRERHRDIGVAMRTTGFLNGPTMAGHQTVLVSASTTGPAAITSASSDMDV